MKKGENFCFEIDQVAGKTTKYFSVLVKVSGLLILLDRYLLSLFRLKQQVSHLLLNDCFTGGIIIREETVYEGEIAEILQRFLKTGKELFLSSLQHIESTSDLDDLLKKLSDLVYKTQEEMKSQDFLDVLSHSSLDPIAFARIIHNYWLYFSNSGSSAPLKLKSMPGSPKVAFKQKPPLREWIPTLKETTQEGRLELRHVDFGDNKKWKAVLYDYLHDRPMVVEINDLKFLEGLKSTESNEENGILHGDVIVARYFIKDDVLLNKTNIQIIEVHDRIRQSQATQLNLFTAGAATQETSPKLALEKPQKAVKKRHSSWNRRS
jgi:hypothetical protein